jgi:hypothetical protein
MLLSTTAKAVLNAATTRSVAWRQVLLTLPGLGPQLHAEAIVCVQAYIAGG